MTSETSPAIAAIAAALSLPPIDLEALRRRVRWLRAMSRHQEAEQLATVIKALEEGAV